MAAKLCDGDSVIHINEAPVVTRLPNNMVCVSQPNGTHHRLMSRAVFQASIFEGMQHIKCWDEEDLQSPTNVILMAR